MKKKVTFLFAFLALLCLAAPRAQAAQTVEIHDAEGLRAMANDPDGSYVLAGNIDLGGEAWTPIAFSGTLDGAGYAIYNVTIDAVGEARATTVDGNEKTYDSVFAGFFSTLTDATVTDLALRNVKVNVSTDEHCFAAMLAGYAERAEIRNCLLEGTVELHSSALMVGVGGAVGFGIANFDDCQIDVTLIHVDESEDILPEVFAGGVIACGYSAVNDCQINIAGYLSCRGYLHSGGIVGMHHQHTHITEDSVTLYSSGNDIRGFIRFFEDNEDRRAYCEAECGENLHWTMSLDGNTKDFEAQEVFEYDTVLLPHDCEEPSYESVVTEPGCVDWGCTTYTCTACGYSYQDEFFAPAHQPGDWQVAVDATFTESGRLEKRCTMCGSLLEEKELPPHVAGEWWVSVEPSYDSAGLRQQLCSDCGAVLAEEELPMLVRASSLLLNAETMRLHYKDETDLTARVLPSIASDSSVHYSSSNPSVVEVDSDGHVRAVGSGKAVIVCESRDGGARAECSVTVGYSLSQWCIRIFLLGFLWY